MKRWTHLIFAVSLAAAGVACADSDRAENRANDPAAVGTAGTEAKKEDAGRADRDFVGDMMADGRAEVELARLAQKKAASREVKDFATMMIRDHQKAGAELKALATQAHIDMTAVDPDMETGKDLHERLAKLSGKEFDRAYMDAMVEDHEKAVEETEKKAEKADNDHVRQWAAKALPTLKKHLDRAKELQVAVK